MSPTDLALSTARLLLAGLFVLAGISKLIDRAGIRQAFVDLGGPSALAPAFARLIPLVELTIALALLPRSTAFAAASGAAALVSVFTVALAISLARGRAVDCHCFGSLSAGRVGGSAIVRNIVLFAMAGWIAVSAIESPGPSLVAWITLLTVPQRAAVAIGGLAIGLLVVQTLLLFRMKRESDMQSAVARERQTSPPALVIGTAAPAFALQALGAAQVTLEQIRTRGKPVVLVFVSPACSPCQAVLSDVEIWERAYADHLTFAVVSRGTDEVNREKFGRFAIARILLQRDREVSEAYRISAAPSALLVHVNGGVGCAPAIGASAIRRLVEEVTA
jgi:uncharacterized membrane protein YphA (DoxX/SURF4 family)/thiol-disulfide isomerase/thioredoxin